MLTGLELTLMGLTRSNSSLFSTPGFVASPVGKRERGGERKEKNKNKQKETKKKQRWEGGKKEIEKEERKEGGKKE